MRSAPPPAAPLGIAAVHLWLPPGRAGVAQALAADTIDQETADRLGYAELTESREHAAPEMAVLAGREALARAGWSGDSLGLVAHAWIYHQGHDFWSPPHYVAHGVGARAATPVGVQQTSNGGVAALEAAAARLALDPSLSRCLVTTADRFTGPGFDRWYGDIDVAYGDGATAVLLHRGPAPYRLLATTSVSAPQYEVLYRGDDPFSAAPRSPHPVVSARRTKLVFRAGGGWPRFVGVLRRSVQRAVLRAMEEADLKPGDRRLRYVVLPRLSTGALTQFYGPSVAELELPGVEILDFGRHSGHLGAGDTAANLAVLDADNRLQPGEAALLLGAGNGFTWSCTAVSRE